MTTDLTVLDKATRIWLKDRPWLGSYWTIEHFDVCRECQHDIMPSIRAEYRRLLAERDREKGIWASERSDSFIRAAKLARAIHARQRP